MAPTLHPPYDDGLAPSASFRPPKPEWWRSAACRGSDPALFHSTPAAHRQAQLICRRCPVAEICLWSAMVDEAPTPYRYGVWGATTPADRARIATELGLDAAGYEALVVAAMASLAPPQVTSAAQEATDAA